MSRVAAICPVPGCGRRTRAGRCAEHRAPELQRRAAKPQARVWADRRWKRVRERVWRRDGHRCLDCGRHRDDLGRNERLVADHANPGGVAATLVDGLPTAASFDADICETLCSTCSGRRDGGRR